MTSEARTPVSISSRISAASRLFSNEVPLQVATRRVMSASDSTGTGTSGTAGGFILAIGLSAISPSDSSHFHICWSDR